MWAHARPAAHTQTHTHTHIQTLCSECGQKLSDSELIAGKLESVSRKLPILDKQLEALDVRINKHLFSIAPHVSWMPFNPLLWTEPVPLGHVNYVL